MIDYRPWPRLKRNHVVEDPQCIGFGFVTISRQMYDTQVRTSSDEALPTTPYPMVGATTSPAHAGVNDLVHWCGTIIIRDSQFLFSLVPV